MVMVILPTLTVPPLTASMMASKVPAAKAKPIITPTEAMPPLTFRILVSATDSPVLVTVTFPAVRFFTRSWARLVLSASTRAALAVTVTAPAPAVKR